MKAVSLPLGIDIGATRLRVAHAVRTPAGPRLRAIAVRNLSSGVCSSADVSDPQYVAALLDETLSELKTKERRCVLALGGPAAILRPLALPKMSAIERERAARYESERWIDFPIAEAAVRVHATPTQGLWAVGVTRRTSIASRVAAVRAARLRPLSVDHESCAFARAFPDFDAVVDMGHERTALHVIGEALPLTFQSQNGGVHVTNAIRRELSIDEHSAEKRKRILGVAGAGERAMTQLASEVSALVRTARASTPVVRVALTGNAARLAGLAYAIESATGALCQTPIPEILRTTDYPEDVIRSSAPDWSLACSLTTWRRP